MSQYIVNPIIQLGSAWLLVQPNGANLPTLVRGRRPLTLQDVTIENKGTIKELQGQAQYPDDTGTVDKKGTFKFSMGREDYDIWNQIFFADTQAAGGTSVQVAESHVIPATPFQVTIAPPGSGTFLNDITVEYADGTGTLTPIQTATLAGQYQVNNGTGQYTFETTDAGKTVLISYAYTVAAQGNSVIVHNQPQGFGPQFSAYVVPIYKPINGINSTILLYACKINSISLNHKRADYADVSMEGAFFANTAGQVIQTYGNQ